MRAAFSPPRTPDPRPRGTPVTTAAAHPRVAAVAAARDTGARGTMDRLGRIEALACADLYRGAPPHLARERGIAARETDGAVLMRVDALPGARAFNRVTGVGAPRAKVERQLAEVRGFFGGAAHAVSADPDSGDGATEFFRAHGYVVDCAWDKFAGAPGRPPPMGGDLAVRTADPADAEAVWEPPRSMWPHEPRGSASGAPAGDGPGPSYRNMLRPGFQPVYRRANLRSPDTHDS